MRWQRPRSPSHKQVVAGVGDCRAVYQGASAKKAVALTTDHRSKDREERNRIRAAGGFVRMGRLFGVLEPSRSVGDIDMKQAKGKKALIAIPCMKYATPHLRSRLHVPYCFFKPQAAALS